MRDIDRIRRRIQKNHNKEPKYRIVGVFNHLILALMLVCVLGLSLMIGNKMQLPFAVHAWDYVQSLQWSSFLPFESWFKNEETQSVTTMTSYQAIGEHRYQNDTNQAVAPFTGMIRHIEMQNDTYCVSLLLDNGTLVNIEHLQEVQVQTQERIKEGSVIGTYQEYVEIHCYLDGNEVKLEEVEA